MVLKALVDSFLPHQKKCGTERVNIGKSFAQLDCKTYTIQETVLMNIKCNSLIYSSAIIYEMSSKVLTPLLYASRTVLISSPHCSSI